jgi:hypothetical protein
VLDSNSENVEMEGKSIWTDGSYLGHGYDLDNEQRVVIDTYWDDDNQWRIILHNHKGNLEKLEQTFPEVFKKYGVEKVVNKEDNFSFYLLKSYSLDEDLSVIARGLAEIREMVEKKVGTLHNLNFMKVEKLRDVFNSISGDIKKEGREIWYEGNYLVHEYNPNNNEQLVVIDTYFEDNQWKIVLYNRERKLEKIEQTFSEILTKYNAGKIQVAKEQRYLLKSYSSDEDLSVIAKDLAEIRDMIEETVEKEIEFDNKMFEKWEKSLKEEYPNYTFDKDINEWGNHAKLIIPIMGTTVRIVIALEKGAGKLYCQVDMGHLKEKRNIPSEVIERAKHLLPLRHKGDPDSERWQYFDRDAYDETYSMLQEVIKILTAIK